MKEKVVRKRVRKKEEKATAYEVSFCLTYTLYDCVSDFVRSLTRDVKVNSYKNWMQDEQHEHSVDLLAYGLIAASSDATETPRVHWELEYTLSSAHPSTFDRDSMFRWGIWTAKCHTHFLLPDDLIICADRKKYSNWDDWIEEKSNEYNLYTSASSALVQLYSV